MSMRFPHQSAIPTCIHHPDEELFFYCNTCHERICELCCQGRHVTHQWKLNKKAAREIRQNTDAICEDIEKMISDLHLDKGAETETEIERIENTRVKWVSTINALADNLKAKARMRESKEISADELTILKKMLKFFKEDIKEADDNVAVEMEEEFHKKIQQFSSQSKTPGKKLVFKEGTLSPDTIQHMFGDVMENNTQSEVKVIERSHFTHIDDSDCIFRIVPLSNNYALINRYNDEHIDHIDAEGNTIKKIPVNSSAFIMLDNDIVFCHFGAKVIRRVTPSGTECDICTTAPLHPRGICISYDGGLLVTLCSCDSAEITSDSYGEVHHIDTSGGIIRKYTHTEDNRDKLFIHPDKVTQNINTDLCVVDIKDKNSTSRLVVLSVTSKLRFIYTGQPDLMRKFSPKDVCCDNRGRIILNCLENDVVFLLSEEGIFLKFLLTEQSPIWGPRALALHDDTLWLGCEKGVVRLYNYSE